VFEVTMSAACNSEVGAGGTAMDEVLRVDSGNGEQRCDQCGAHLAEVVTECPFCGARMLNLVSLEEETRVFLESLEVRLIEAVSGYPDGLMVQALFLFLFIVAGPACYLLLDSHTDLGLLARIGLAVAASFAALVVFGTQVVRRDERAQTRAWREVVSPAVRRYAGRKGFSDTELLTLARRLLDEGSQLR
jgi:hypothetical protein